MDRVLKRVAVAACVAFLASGIPIDVAAQSMEPSVSSGWVRMPAEGATSTQAYAVVENPTMYAFYVMKASADVAASVELRQTDKDAVLEFFTVPAYGSLDMDAEGVYLFLKNLKKPLAEGDKVVLTVVTEIGLEFRVEATAQRTRPNPH
ncbi:MAG: copper chaperone PCu(A)C [Acidobacteria bacterium]|nr:copper chaperone PCu(A)C [Acidobacteriota bacterium]